MRIQQAEQIINEAKADRRLKAEIVGTGSKARGYQVRLTLRNLRCVLVRDWYDWQDIQAVWREM